MKKCLMMMVAVLAIVAITVPAFAAEFSYGGVFRARIISQDNITNGNDNLDDNLNRIDQRLRLYFYFVASENLRVVTKFEMGDTTWGNLGTGGPVGADERIVEVKNAYMEFNIPNTPVTALVGIQGLALLDSWIIDDDFSAAVVKAKFDPIVVTAGYVAGQNADFTTTDNNIDSFFGAVDYACGPFSAQGVVFYQYGHDTLISTVPSDLSTPVRVVVPGFEGIVENNNLIDLGVKLGYKMDFMSAYMNFVKNLGSVDVGNDSYDYTGWMIDAGANFFYGPFTFNVGGFYTTGQDINDDGTLKGDDIDWFTYPLATSKYFSEIVGGGILDNVGPNRGYWAGYGFPFNLWTVTVGAAWQAMEKTKLSASYWYFGTAEDVPTGFDALGRLETSSSIGHEFDIYLTQGIVDGLNLDLVAAYLIADDAFGQPFSGVADDAYELGARLQWAF